MTPATSESVDDRDIYVSAGEAGIVLGRELERQAIAAWLRKLKTRRAYKDLLLTLARGIELGVQDGVEDVAE